MKLVSLFSGRRVVDILVVFALVVVVFQPGPVRAQLVTSDPATQGLTVLQTVGDYIGKAWDKARASLTDALEKTAAIAYRQGITYFLNKVAQDTATWVASGGKGQQPLFVTEGWGEYLKDAGDGAVGTVIDGLTASGGVLEGFNICNPRLDVILRVNLGLTRYNQQRPRCTFSQLINNWDREITRRDFLSNFQLSFDSNQSPLGASLVVNGVALERTQLARDIAEKARLENDGFKPVQDLITGAIETPGNLVAETLFDAFGGANNQYLIATGDAVADAVNNFTSSVVSQLLNNVLKKGLGGGSGPGSARRIGASQTLNNPQASIVGEGVGGASIRLAQDVSPSFTTPGQYDVLTLLSTCSNASKPSPNSCAITQNMRTAISQRLTVKEAVEKGLFNADGPFGFVTRTPQPIEPSYTDGVPYRTILLLRKYRIVPVGWELAARYIENFSNDEEQQQFTLKYLMEQYDVPGPFYRLVDPNWALVTPDAYCKLQGPGPELLSNEVVKAVDINNDGKYNLPGESPATVRVDRAENYCADEQSCIQRDDKGNCKFYGYCTEEKRVWNFGAKACEAQFNTCTTVASSNGDTASYLLNTVQGMTECNEKPFPDGCTQYSRVKTISQDPDIKSDDWSPRIEDSVFLNDKAQDCDASDAGCRAFIRPGYSQASDALTGANVIENPSFEATPTSGAGGASIVPGGWVGLPASGLKQNQTDAAVEGSYFHVTSGIVGYQWTIGRRVGTTSVGVDLSGRSLSLAFQARNGSGGVPGNVVLASQDGSYTGTFTYRETPPVLTNDWQPYTGTLQLPDGLGERYRFSVRFLLPSGTDFDAVKLEVGSSGTSYSTYGQGASNATVHLKRAPDYLATQDQTNPFHGIGNSCRPTRPADNQADKPDQEMCKPYARFCLAEEAGCLQYVPKNGSSAITAVRGDACPAQCVGYDTYTQSKTFFESSKFVDLIPTTAKKCSAARAGCDEFTNLDEIARGGEGKEYYQQIRYCQKKGQSDEGTFYTWEGSDTAGYQLKVFTLKKSNITSSFAPCTNLGWDSNGETSSCLDDSSNVSVELCNASTYGADPDCRQFYDADGNISYRFHSRTVSVTDDCRPYRKTQSTQTDCQGSGGFWDAGTSSCRYQAVPKEGLRCPASAAGCREYRGGTSGNYNVVSGDTFENGTGGWQQGRLSAVSNNVGGHSYEFTSTSDEIVKEVSAVQDAGRSLVPGTEYKITLDARQQGNSPNPISLEVFIDSGEGASQKTTAMTATPFALKAGAEAGWVTYETDAKVIDFASTTAGANPQVTIRIKRGSLGGDAVYVDNIALRSNVNTFYLIKATSQIPAACNSPVSFLGCQQYQVSDGKTKNIYQFGEACHEKVIGCEAVIDTQNTTRGAVAPLAQTYRGDLTVPADQLDFIVNTKDKQCRGQAQGCEALGVPSSNVARLCSAGAGDCNDDGFVTIDELVTGVNLALNNESAATCKNLDINNNDQITIDELTRAVSNATAGIPGAGDIINEAARGDITKEEAERRLRALGFVPKLCVDPKVAVTGWETKHKMNNPDVYDTNTNADDGILCRADQVQCMRYKDARGGEWRFKDPGNKACEYRTDKQKAGWYILDPNNEINATTPDCDELLVGRSPSTHKAGGVAQPKAGWTGVCPAATDSCREVVDPRSDEGRELLLNSSFLLPDGNFPADWTSYASSVYSAGLHEVRVNSSGAKDGFWQRVTLRDATDYVVSANVKSGGTVDPNASAYIGIESCTGAQITGRPYAFITPRSASQFEQVSFRIYVADNGEQSGDVTCTIVAGQARDFIDATPTTDFAESPFVFNNVSVRETRLHYQLQNGLDEKTCNGNVNNSNCVLINDQAGLTQGSKPLNIAADTSPLLNSSSVDARTRVEYRCEEVPGNKKECRGMEGVSCTSDADCQTQFTANKVVRVTPDRECGAWLSCKTTRKITQNGVTKNVCLEVKGCEELDANGVCIRETPEYSDKNLTFTASNIDLIKNRSGFSKVGFDWNPGATGADQKIVQGYLPVQFMKELANTISVFNGDFESSSVDGKPIGWDVGLNGNDRLKVVDSPIAAQNASVSYPAEGAKLLEVNANQSKPEVNEVPTGNLSNFIQVSADTRYTISAMVNTINFRGKATDIRVYEYDSDKVVTEDVVVPGSPSTLNRGSYHSVLNLGPGINWTRLTDTFKTSPSTRYIRIQLTWDAVDANGGFWHLDDLSMKSALTYQKNEIETRVCRGNPSQSCVNDIVCGNLGPCAAYNSPSFPALSYERGTDSSTSTSDATGWIGYNNIAQSCQLYPRPDAISCRYTDKNGIRQRGKQGYCLDWDPSNPNYCLQWWPIDSVVGEDIEEDRAGYLDRTPLYQCLNASVGWTRIDTLPPHQFGGGQEPPFYQWGGGGPGSANFIVGRLTPGADAPGRGQSAYPYVQFRLQQPGRDVSGIGSTNGIRDIAGECNVLSGGAGCEIVVRTKDEGSSNNANFDLDIGRLKTDGTIDWWRIKRWTPQAGEASNPYVAYFDMKSGWDIEDTDEWLQTKDFDDSTSPTTISGAFHFLRLSDWTDNSSASGDNNTSIKSVEARLVAGCTALVQTVTPSGDNRAWASRLTQNSSYVVPDLNYTWNTDYKPFGAAVPPEPAEDPTQWDGTQIDGIQPLSAEVPQTKGTDAQGNSVNVPPPYQARAGNPYSCLINGTDCEGVGVVGDDLDEAVSNAIQRLRLLFVESYGMWKWEPSRCEGGPTPGKVCVNDGMCSAGNNKGICKSGGYRSWNQVVYDGPPSTACPDNVRPSASSTSQLCGVAPVVPTISLSQTTVKKQARVTLSFTTLVDPDQAPIVRYIVDWGDGVQTPITGIRLQSRPSPENAIVLSHEYSYESMRRTRGAPTPSSSCPIGYCVTPRVQVLDNWGWCNGNYSAVDPNNPFRGQPQYYSGDNECDPTGTAWASSRTTINITAQ